MNLEEFKKFETKKVRCSLKNASLDTSDNKNEYLSNCEAAVINFDRVKTEYLNSNGLSEEYAKSVDALFKMKKEKICLVEFKNGDFTNQELKAKIKDSLMVFNSITNNQLEFDRENLIFVLVYNGKVKHVDYKQLIAMHKAKRGDLDCFPFGLDKLKYYCLKDIDVIEKSEFDDSKYVRNIIGL